MTQPGQIGSGVSNDGDLMRMMADMDRRIKELAAADPYRPMGITPTPDGFTVTGTETVTGALIVNGPETVNGTQTVNGPLNVNGAMAVTGTLSLPAGIIDNAALSNPLTVGSNNADAIGFTVPKTTTTTITSFAFTVPAGYTKVDIVAFGSAFVYNAGAATDYVYARVYIGTYGGMTLRSLIGSSGGSVALTPNVTHHIDGLTSGATITISLMMSTDNNAITDSTNQADVTATAFFTR
jgi:hypothetical protein